MQPAENLIIETHNQVTTIVINRPHVRNALDRQAARDLRAAFAEFDAHPQARVAVLTGADGYFCAGADLKELAAGTDYEPWATSSQGPTRPLLSKPVIAAIAGHACAGGLGLALWCDIRIAEEGAVFGVFSRRWGVPMSDGTTVRLPRLVGMGRALDMLLTGRAVEAREAVEMGLATRLVPAGEARKAAETLAHRIAEFPQTAMRSDRRSAYLQNGLTMDAALQSETNLAQAARRTEARAGAERFASGQGRHGDFSDF